MGFRIEGNTLIGYDDEPGVTRAVVPDSVRRINRHAFKQSSITSVVIPDSVEYIEIDAFYQCENLVKVTIPEKSTVITHYVFFECPRFTANISIRDWEPAFGLEKSLYARNYMNNYDANDPHYELYHEANSRYIRSHLDKIIKTLNNSDIGVITYLTCEKMLGLNRTNRLLDMMSGDIEATAILLDYKHNTFPKEYLERYERENTEKKLGQRERTLTDWRRIFKLVNDGSGGWGIAGYRGTDTSVVIPETINNKTVTKIMSNAFDSTENHAHIIEDVILPDTITVIENGAFECCHNLKSITLSNNLEKIENGAFYSTGLTSVTIPDSVTYIGEYSFSSCTDLENVVLSENLKEIGCRAFEDCTRLAAINLPESLSKINVNAFANCISLTEIEIPSGITRIPYSMFSECESLEKVTLPDSIKSIERNAFRGCKSLAAINIPNGVTEILRCAFRNCSALTSVTLPDSLLVLEEEAFNECSELEDITIPPSIKFIGDDCFDKTPWLDNQTKEFVIVGNGILLNYNGTDSEVMIPAGVTGIGCAAFSDNQNLTGVTIPEGVIEIARDAFYCCSNLTHVALPQGLMTIGEFAFFKTAVSEITLPEGVNEINSGAFSHTPLRSVTIPQSVRSIGRGAFPQLAEAFLPENLLKLGKSMLYYTLYLDNLSADYIIIGDLLCKYNGISQKAIVPDYIRVIGAQAFRQNQYVTEIIIPDSVTEIGEDAFGDCENLESIVLPDTLTKLGSFDPSQNKTTLQVRYKVTAYGYSDIPGLLQMINTQGSR